MFLPGIGIDDEGFHDGHVGGQAANDFERQQRVAKVIQHAQEKHHVELAQTRRGQFVEIQHTVIDLGPQPPVNLQERRDLHAIDGHGLGRRGAPLQS